MDYSKKSKKELIKEIETLKKDIDFTSDNNYKNLFNNSPNLLYIQNKDGKFLDVNKAVEKIYGFKKEEIIGKYPDFLAGEGNNLEKVKNLILKAWEGKKQEFEFIGKKKNGVFFTKKIIVQKELYFGNEVLISSGIDITEQKIIEEHLKESEARYKNIFTKNLAGVYITENDIIVECNNSFAKIFGYKSRVELIGKNIIETFYNKEYFNNFLRDLTNNKQLKRYTVKSKKNKGKELWISTNVSINYLSKKKYKIEGTVIDITKEIETEKKITESREKYKELTDNSPYGVLVHVDDKIIYCNKKATEIIGLESQKLSEKYFYDIIIPENIKEIKARNKSALSGKIVPFKEFTIKNYKKKSLHYIKAKPTLIKFGNKKGIQIVFNDVTLEKELLKEKIKTKVAEESNLILQKEIKARKIIEKELIKKQKYIKSYINSSLDIICASDQKGNIIEFNKAAENAFGYTFKEVKNKKSNILYALKNEYEAVNKEILVNKSFTGEIKNRTKDGEIFTSFLTASILYNDKGEEIGAMGVSRNITVLKEAEEQLIESEEKYRDILENATDLIQSLDINGNILYVNEAWKKTTGYKTEEILNKNIFEFIHPDCEEKCKNIFEKIKKSKEGEGTTVSIELKTKKGNKIIVEGSVSVKFKEGKPLSTRSILRNCTDEKWEETKQNIYNNISKIVVEKSTPIDIYEGIRKELSKVINTETFVISYYQDRSLVTFPYYYDTINANGIVNRASRINGKGINEYFLKQKEAQLLKREDLDKILNKGEYKVLGKKCQSFIGVPLKIKNEVVGVLSVQSFKNKKEFNSQSIEILEFISGIIALTVQRKQDENLIEEQSSKLKSIIENSTHLFWTYDLIRGVTSSNTNFDDHIKSTYNRKVDIKKGSKEKVRFSDKEEHLFWDKKYNEAFKGKTQWFFSKKENKKGELIVKEVFLNPIYNKEGKIVEISGIAHDITEKTISEQKLKESLKEKEVLLKEVHHRVKNNLQVISSILNLQSSYVKDQKILDILRESQNRIKSMSFIHESLYQTTNFSEINFSQYIVSLSKNLVHSYGIYDNFIDLKLSVGDISLNLDLSIPCGLIINELVSNALKYAFSKTEKGEIKIELLEKKEDIYLIVKDNGNGFPKQINYKKTESLGLQLVTTLVEQINGKIELDNSNGVKFTIIFKKDQ